MAASFVTLILLFVFTRCEILRWNWEFVPTFDTATTLDQTTPRLRVFDAVAGNPQHPGGRDSGHCSPVDYLTYSPFSELLYLFSGIVRPIPTNSFYGGDLWSWDPVTHVWTFINTAIPGGAYEDIQKSEAEFPGRIENPGDVFPGPRYQSHLLALTSSPRVRLFGTGIMYDGLTRPEHIGDIWDFDIGTERWTSREIYPGCWDDDLDVPETTTPPFYPRYNSKDPVWVVGSDLVYWDAENTLPDRMWHFDDTDTTWDFLPTPSSGSVPPEMFGGPGDKPFSARWVVGDVYTSATLYLLFAGKEVSNMATRVYTFSWTANEWSLIYSPPSESTPSFRYGHVSPDVGGVSWPGIRGGFITGGKLNDDYAYLLNGQGFPADGNTAYGYLAELWLFHYTASNLTKGWKFIQVTDGLETAAVKTPVSVGDYTPGNQYPGGRKGAAAAAQDGTLFFGFGTVEPAPTFALGGDMWKLEFSFCGSVISNDPTVCGGVTHGSCDGSGGCLCSSGWTGTDCLLVDPPCGTLYESDPNVCGGAAQGSCDGSGGCVCVPGWLGTDCGDVDPLCGTLYESDPSVCGGVTHGSCDGLTGCACTADWEGIDCETAKQAGSTPSGTGGDVSAAEVAGIVVGSVLVAAIIAAGPVLLVVIGVVWMVTRGATKTVPPVLVEDVVKVKLQELGEEDAKMKESGGGNESSDD